MASDEDDEDEDEEYEDDDDDEDELVPFSFSSISKDFPPDAPVGAPRILEAHPKYSFDEDVFDRSTLRLADGLATYLYHYDPVAAKMFFDLNRAKFEYCFRRGEPWLDVTIARLGRLVTVGYLKKADYENKYMFLLSTSQRKLIPLVGIDVGAGINTRKPSIVEELGANFGLSIVSSRDWLWASTDPKSRFAKWTKLPNEEGYGWEDSGQEQLYGLPEGWENMTDEQLGIPKF